MLVQAIEKLDLFMLFIKIPPTKQNFAWCFLTPKTAHTEVFYQGGTITPPSQLKRNVGQIRGVYERDRTIHRIIHVEKAQTRRKKLKEQEKTVDSPRTMVYNIIIKLKKTEKIND